VKKHRLRPEGMAAQWMNTVGDRSG
jgi:hypothetical protein